MTAVSDDGSLGERALVTKPLEQAILEKRPDLVMACGPAPMLAAVQALCEKYALPCQISLEERMAAALRLPGLQCEDQDGGRRLVL